MVFRFRAREAFRLIFWPALVLRVVPCVLFYRGLMAVWYDLVQLRVAPFPIQKDQADKRHHTVVGKRQHKEMVEAHRRVVIDKASWFWQRHIAPHTPHRASAL